MGEKDLIKGINHPDNAILLCICNHPSMETLSKVDSYCKPLSPPMRIWDKFIKAGEKGNKGAGFHRFEGEYLTHLQENTDAYEQCQKVKARAKARPIILAGAISDSTYSEARLAADFIENVCELPTPDQ